MTSNILALLAAIGLISLLLIVGGFIEALKQAVTIP